MSLNTTDFLARAVSPYKEMGAYEALWSEEGASFKKIAERFQSSTGDVPTDFVEPSKAEEFARRAVADLTEAGITRFGVRVHGAGEYPLRLRDAEYPVELLYYRGWWDLALSPSVAVVGTRRPSEEGVSRARRLSRKLVEGGFTVVSGLADGIDSVAHQTAIENGGQTIAVIGTPLNVSYPAKNRDLQERIARDFLLISQVPLTLYRMRRPDANRWLFPERNKTMSALTLATVIVEAGETSGTLTQARAALKQGRKLFILDNCFQNPDLTWPARFEKQGAIRVREYDDIARELPRTIHPN